MKFVNINLSRSLKNKGFDKECLACYDANGIITSYSSDILKFVNYNSIGDVVSAPTYQEVIDWFRNKHNLLLSSTPFIQSQFDERKPKFYSNIILWMDPKTYEKEERLSYFIHEGKNTYVDYYDALNEAIVEAIKLI